VTIAPAATVVGLLVAPLAIAVSFRGPRDRFWSRMTATGAGLAAIALLARPPGPRPPGARPPGRRPSGPRPPGRRRPSAGSALVGLGSAVVLAATFRAGDRLARRVVPGAAEQIGALHELGSIVPRRELALRLGLIGTAEELFWRGLVQAALMERYGRWPGAGVATAAYAGAHLGTGNLTLIGAAGVAGAHWSALCAAGAPLGALAVSHVAWDLWIFLGPSPSAGPVAGPA
jgi:uncharacterized protein